MTTSKDETQIRQLVENWAKAVRSKDIDAILAHHSENIIMYDVPEPFQSKGIEAYRSTWDLFFSWSNNLGVFDIHELHITAGEDVAFCVAAMQCAGLNKIGEKEVLDFRLTVGLKKISNQWTVMHEHHSLPSK